MKCAKDLVEKVLEGADPKTLVSSNLSELELPDIFGRRQSGDISRSPLYKAVEKLIAETETNETLLRRASRKLYKIADQLDAGSISLEEAKKRAADAWVSVTSAADRLSVMHTEYSNMFKRM